MHSRTLDPCSIVHVQSWDITARAPTTIHDVLGTAWPHEVGAVASGLVDILCVGPTDWLMVDSIPGVGERRDKIRTALLETPLRATDRSHSLMRLEFAGPGVREFLLQTCSLDLHRFPPARCARTRFAGVPAILRCHDPLKFEGIVSTSHKEYLTTWIAGAFASVG
jgi:heterotetrameric sarcosine oxidase gamma subunit